MERNKEGKRNEIDKNANFVGFDQKRMNYIVHEPKYHPGHFFNQKQLRYHQKIYAEEWDKLE